MTPRTLTAPAPTESPSPPRHGQTIVVFGATGEAARRRLLPALYNLAHDQCLPEPLWLVGVSAEELSDAAFRALVAEAVRRWSRRAPDPAVLGRLTGQARHVAGDPAEARTYDALAAALADAASDRWFHLGPTTERVPVVAAGLADRRLHRRGDGEVRVVVEGPYGASLREARRLDRALLSAFGEEQIFRIDHLLAKDTVEDLLAFRFANGIFEPVWDRNHIELIEITAAEDAGAGEDAAAYDRLGALREVVQNHLLEMLCHVAVEPFVRFAPKELRDERAKVLAAIAPVEHAVRGQYAAGVIAGRPVRGYRDEPGVAPGSRTETYVALRADVRTWRWEGVPFYLRTGLRLARRMTEVAITLRPVPSLPFRDEGSAGAEPNQLILTIDPSHSTSLKLVAKIPGPRMRLRTLKMDALQPPHVPDAYEALLLDSLRGDQTLFPRRDEVELRWCLVEPLLQAWRDAPDAPEPYAAGTQGPASAAAALAPGHRWRAL